MLLNRSFDFSFTDAKIFENAMAYFFEVDFFPRQKDFSTHLPIKLVDRICVDRILLIIRRKWSFIFEKIAKESLGPLFQNLYWAKSRRIRLFLSIRFSVWNFFLNINDLFTYNFRCSSMDVNVHRKNGQYDW